RVEVLALGAVEVDRDERSLFGPFGELEEQDPAPGAGVHFVAATQEPTACQLEVPVVLRGHRVEVTAGDPKRAHVTDRLEHRRSAYGDGPQGREGGELVEQTRHGPA